MGAYVLWTLLAVICVLLLLPIRIRFVRNESECRLTMFYACISVMQKSFRKIPDAKPQQDADSPSATAQETESQPDRSAKEASASQSDPPNHNIPDTAETPTVSSRSAPDADAAENEPIFDHPPEQEDAVDNPVKRRKKPGIVERLKPHNFSEWLGLIGDVLHSLTPMLRWLLGHFHIRKATFELRIASDDAAKTAILYGSASTLVFQTLGFLQSLLDVEVERCQVQADFCGTSIDCNVSAELRVSPAALLGTALGLVARFVYFSFRRLRRQDALAKQEQQAAAVKQSG